MKTLGPLACIALFLVSCSESPVRVEKFTSEEFAPTTQIVVLNGWPTDRKFLTIGTLETDAEGDGSAALARISAQAKGIGADAVVIGAPHRHGRLRVPLGGSNIGGPHGFGNVDLIRIQAVAIRFLH